jgi:hypothetical protein
MWRQHPRFKRLHGYDPVLYGCRQCGYLERALSRVGLADT